MILVSGATQPSTTGSSRFPTSRQHVRLHHRRHARHPGTGTITTQPAGLATRSTIAAINRSGSTPASPGQSRLRQRADVLISGAGQPEYNGTFTITVVDANTFTYPSPPRPRPRHGTIAAQPYGICRSGSTAIVAFPGHGFSVGDPVVISGATQAEYNGAFTITGVTANTFTFNISGTPASPATGSITVQLLRVTRSGSTVTSRSPTTATSTGRPFSSAGPHSPNTTGPFVIANVTANTFDYTIAGAPASPATGTISAQPYDICRSGSTAIVPIQSRPCRRQYGHDHRGRPARVQWHVCDLRALAQRVQLHRLRHAGVARHGQHLCQRLRDERRAHARREFPSANLQQSFSYGGSLLREPGRTSAAAR